jgi:hypothetical protein
VLKYTSKSQKKLDTNISLISLRDLAGIPGPERLPAACEDSRSGPQLAGGPEREFESLLSKAHISPWENKKPFIEWSTGASLLKVSRGGKRDVLARGKRGKIKGFSSASRRRLLYTIARIRRDATLPLFVTLTYPKKYPDARSSKRHLDMFEKRLKRAFPKVGGIWKIEPQGRGAPHYHCLIWGSDIEKMRKFIPAIWFQIAGSGDEYHKKWHEGTCGNGNTHCVQQVKSFRGVMAYASKYLGKTFVVEGWEFAGRYWGVINRENIPFGETIIQELTRSKAVEMMRYQRRFAYPKKNMRFRCNMSTTIFCDADQWVKRLDIIPGEVYLL